MKDVILYHQQNKLEHSDFKITVKILFQAVVFTVGENKIKCAPIYDVVYNRQDTSIPCFELQLPLT